jgi:hypothetical protein
MRRARVLLPILLCAGMATGCGESRAPTAVVPTVPPAARTSFSLTVRGGYGAGTYAAGDTVYPFAAFTATNSVLGGWTGDGVASALTEWSGRFVMPARDVALTVAATPLAAPLTVGSFAGVTARAKAYRYVIPPNARGLILAFHGTGGSSRIIEKGEGYAITLEAVAAGFGVLAYDSEETVAGDLDGNGKLRWDVSASATNIDFANLNALVAQLRTRGLISAALPLYAFGMSNGSSMVVTLGALGTQPALAAPFPNLRFRAIAGYCAPGASSAVAVTVTPTAWYVCRNDTNDEVGPDGNLRSAQHNATLMSRGIATDLAYNEPAPLYDERFTRAGTIDATTSRALVAELNARGFLDGRRFVNRPPEQIVADIQARGAAGYPTFARLTGDQLADAIDALRETYADHQLFSDAARRMLAFFGRF